MIGKTPFLAQRRPVAQHLAGRGVMVVFVFRYQSCRIRVRHHQIVFIAEAAFDVAVAADDADQVAAAVVFVADQRAANPDRFTEDGQALQQRHRQQPHFGRLFIRHIAEVQREHPAVAVDDVLRQTGQRMIDETLMVAVGSFNSPRSDTLSFGYHLPSFANTTGVFASAAVTPVAGDPSGFTFVAS